jgi:hypothetical protein
LNTLGTMPENVIPQVSGGTERPGRVLRLTNLSPLFDPERHQLYFDLLERAIDAPGVKNVALTGAYGTGKSSVLENLNRTRADRLISLSLSTIAPEIHDTANDDEEESKSRSNLIQKEIVKQLLYRLPPKAVPQSRFRRASSPDRARERGLALLGGSLLFAVLVALDLVSPIVERLTPTWRQTVAYAVLFASTVGLGWVFVRIARSRPAVSASVRTGPAMITLSEQSGTYFDEYLDEIVYFFQASRRDIVVIEDIDRFEDVQVFDTLRALNGLLNGSGQVGRRVVFVYAIRDSVFEQIGSADGGDSGEGHAEVDRARSALKRASRTKFFDVIIPVVPFVSADNARDVMSEVMTSDDFTVDPALIRLAARHVADMRMIHNIRNEFEVYRNRLVAPDERIPGITDDLVFAIVLFKNTHLSDFEKIRYRESALDRVYTAWRHAVSQGLDEHAQHLAALRERRFKHESAQVRATQLGRRLARLQKALLAAAQAQAAQVTVDVSGPVDASTMEDAEAWSRVASGESISIIIRNPSPYNRATVNLSFSVEQLSAALGIEIDPDEWKDTDLAEVDASIQKVETNLQFLRHHTWKELCERQDLRFNGAELGIRDASGHSIEGSVTFREVITATLESDLARQLVIGGFLTSHFALYASSYYGNHLGPDAMEYIRRCIEPGEPDPTFSLNETEVVQILREQDAESDDAAGIFDDPSVFNVNILDHLLSDRPQAASRVAARLAVMNHLERGFIDTYMSQGQRPGSLLGAIAPHWDGVAQYAATAPVDPATRPALLDATLRALPGTDFATGDEVRTVIEQNYRDMQAICAPSSAERASIVLAVVRSSGASLDSLEPLNELARRAAVKLRVFPITEANLRVLVPSGAIGVDALKENEHAYRYVLDHLAEFIAIADNSVDVTPVVDNEMFPVVLSDAAERAPLSILTDFVAKSSAECRVSNLRDVAPKAWPALAVNNRTHASYKNVAAYLDQFEMDAPLGRLLNKQKKIVDAGAASAGDRIKLAATVLAAREVIPSANTRVQIVASIKPGTIAASEIVPESGSLVAKLLKRRLMEDDATAFSAELMVDWSTREHAIAASKNFASFVSVDVLPPSQVPDLIRSVKVPKHVRLSVVRNIATFAGGASPSQVRSIAAALVETGWRMPLASLEALRAAGASPAQVIALASTRGEQLSLTDLKTLLSSLGGEYQRVATGGRGRPAFTNDAAHEYVLGRLVGDTIKQVEVGNFKLRGRRLVASLQRPA